MMSLRHSETKPEKTLKEKFYTYSNTMTTAELKSMLKAILSAIRIHIQKIEELEATSALLSEGLMMIGDRTIKTQKQLKLLSKLVEAQAEDEEDEADSISLGSEDTASEDETEEDEDMSVDSETSSESESESEEEEYCTCNEEHDVLVIPIKRRRVD